MVKNKLLKIEKKLREFIDKTKFKNKIYAVGVFGSILTDFYQKDSDIDIMIFGNLSVEEKIKLISKLINEFLKEKIDVHFSDEYDYISFPIKIVWFNKNYSEKLIELIDPFSRDELIDKELLKEYLKLKLSN